MYIVVFQTREEKKLQDIMKYFEKIEKRQERRKEALARLDHKKHPRCESTEMAPEPVSMAAATTTTTAVDFQNQSASNGQFSDSDTKIVIKLEDPPSAESPQKNRYLQSCSFKKKIKICTFCLSLTPYL